MQPGDVRRVNPEALELPDGYQAEALVVGLTLPAGIAFGPEGEIYLAERGCIQGAWFGPARIMRIDPGGELMELGVLDQPIASIVFHEGNLYIAEDAVDARILKVDSQGEVSTVVEGLPGGGDYGFSSLALDHQSNITFGIGTRTNSGIAGADNLERGWLLDHPQLADVPGVDVTLAGVNYVNTSGVAGLPDGPTGAFHACGEASEPGERVPGAELCSGGVYRWDPATEKLSRAAWGLRSIVGVTLGPANRMFCTEGGIEPRGSRPAAGVPDVLWEVRSGSYYGWPDQAAGRPLADYAGAGLGPQPELIKGGSSAAAEPIATFPAGSGVGRLDFCGSRDFGLAGDFLVALAGPWLPGPVEGDHSPVVVRVDSRNGDISTFISNRNGDVDPEGLIRPFDVAFDPGGEVLYVLDLGIVEAHPGGSLSVVGRTGVLWRISRDGGSSDEGLDESPATGEPAEAEDPEGADGPETGAPEAGAPEKPAKRARPSRARTRKPAADAETDGASDSDEPPPDHGGIPAGEPISHGELEARQETEAAAEAEPPEVPIEHVHPETPPASLDEVLRQAGEQEQVEPAPGASGEDGENR